MEHNKHPSTWADGPEEIEQSSNEFVKEEEESEPKTLDEYLERMHRLDPPIDYSKAPKPFPVRMVPRLHYSPSHSDSDSYTSESDSDTKVVAQEDSGIQTFHLSKIEAKTLDEYLEIMHKLDPPIDYSKAPKPFPVRMVPRLHYSPSDSDDSSDFSDSDFEASAEEEFQLQKENSPEDTTKEVEFQPNATPEDLMLNAPASSILVKHGAKRKAEAGDKDAKQANTTQE